MSDNDKPYISALSFSWLTPIYDFFLRATMREELLKRTLIRQARIQPGMRVLDLGCGTGTLMIWIKQAYPAAEVVGLDGDPAILEIARAKAQVAGVDVNFDQGMAYQLPYPDRSFDRVLSSLVIHHLVTTDKQRTMSEARRVLRRGGELHIVDFGKPRGGYARFVAPLMRHLEQAGDNFAGRLPEMMKKAGFTQVEEPVQVTTIFGGVSLFRAGK